MVGYDFLCIELYPHPAFLYFNGVKTLTPHNLNVKIK